MIQIQCDHPDTHPPRGRRRGFTLTELMISLALVLLIVLAVTQIFGITTAVISKGNATGDVVRGLDATRTALQMDFTGTDEMAYDVFSNTGGILPLAAQPSIIISSSMVPTFLDADDLEGDSDYDPADTFANRITQTLTIDSDNDGTDDFNIAPYSLGQRWFRTDSISFFTEGEFESQTNLGQGGFAGETSSNEAWVWYGHGRVYDGQSQLNMTGSYGRPGEADPDTNPNAFFASDFRLLRTAMLLKAPTDHDGLPGTANTVTNDDGLPIYHVRARWDQQNPTTSALWVPAGPARPAYPNLGPLGYERTADVGSGTSPVSVFEAGSSSVYGATSTATYDADHVSVTDGQTAYTVMDSRVDVAGVDSSTFRERLSAAQRYDRTSTDPLSGEGNGPMTIGSSDYNVPVATWYELMFGRSPYWSSTRTSDFRFWVNPLVLKPLDAGEVSQATSLLLGGASNFIAEFAGDFLTQNDIGNATAALPDGVIDFTIDAAGVRHIRWYGMPRDVDGDGTIPGPAATGTVSTPWGTSNALLTSTDVRPVADYLVATVVNGMTVNTGYPFEKRLPGDYSGTGSQGVPQNRQQIEDYAAETLDEYGYLAAWGPGDFDGDLYPNTTHDSTFISPQNPTGALRPSLIRVIVQGIDVNGRLDNSLSTELVFAVPAE